MRKILFVVWLILFVVVFFLFNYSTGHKETGVDFNSSALIFVRDSDHYLGHKDLSVIAKCSSLTQKINIVHSDNECSEAIRFYDNANLLILRRSLQHCLADMRWEWRRDSWFSANGQPVLEIGYDGLGNIIKITRSYEF